MLRDMEHEIIPMALKFGMAIAPFSVLGGGKLQSKKQVSLGKAWISESLDFWT